ncbi:hypothetical protein SteCoe_36457 [Stentor coeruleus]|uniref:peptidylprolyl isomerase n=1 Tax=Stentor coeruleus TaxID=5963 RepID=A0A1R2AQ39_9CILI|nr:hypothetical protein SteCoe_36457 [Stentor coeruleus]
MESKSLDQVYKDFWVAWRESERVYYKLLRPTAEELILKDLMARINLGNQLKEDGNKFFRSQDFTSAIQKYIEAIEAVPRDLFENRLIDDYIKLKLTVITNLSMCFLKCKNYEAAVLQCTEGLKIFPKNIKLRYILGCAYGETGDYESALEALKDAKNLDPSNRDIIEKISLYAKAKKEYNIKMKEMFGGKLIPIVKNDLIPEIKSPDINIKPISEPKSKQIPQENNTNYIPYIALGAASLLGLGYYFLKKHK